MYKVIVRFQDLQDEERHIYEVGESFPRLNVEVSKKRLDELAGSDNKIGKAVIKEVSEDVDVDRGVSGTEKLVRQRPEKVSRKVRNK